MSPRGYLPGYVWDERMSYGGRYRIVLPDGRLGQLVSRERIIEGLRSMTLQSQKLLSDLAEDVVAGYLLPADFQQAAMLTLRSLYGSTSALARGGWDRMDAAAWGRNGQLLRTEYTYLRRFTQELTDGNLTAAQARMRAGLYAGRAYSRFWDEDRRVAIAENRGTEERWIALDDPATCGDCLTLEAKGWVPIGTLPNPGDGSTECLGNCRCRRDTR
jgi:hypothetical protein